MMGCETQGSEETPHHPLAPDTTSSSSSSSTLIIDHPFSNSYHTTTTTLSAPSESEPEPEPEPQSHHPLSSNSNSDPLQSQALHSDPTPNLTSHHLHDSDYSDLLITSPTRELNGNPNANLLSRTHPPPPPLPSFHSDNLNITVTNPQKEQDVSSNSIVPGTNTYVTYLITTKTNMRSFGGSNFSVRRRFKDVVTLADRLSDSYRGFFIPARPDKSVVESQVMHKQEFVEQRTVALQKYLQKLASHPVIRKSDELRVFLQVPGKLPFPTTSTTHMASRMLDGAAKLPKHLFGVAPSPTPPQHYQAVSAHPPKGGGAMDFMRLFKEFKQSVTNDWGNSRPPIVEEDNAFLDKKQDLHDFELRLTDASKQAETLVKSQQDMADTMGEMGLSFFKLTKFENEEAILDTQRARAAELKTIATGAVKASRIYRDLNAKTVKDLDSLHEYLGVMLAVRNAYSDRASALLTVQTLLSELSSLQSKSEKLEAASSKVFGGDKSRIKIEELKETIRITEDSKNCAVREYEQIKENNRSELGRLEREKHADFLNMLKGFVSDQVNCAEKMANLWSKVAEDTRGYAKEAP